MHKDHVMTCLSFSRFLESVLPNGFQFHPFPDSNICHSPSKVATVNMSAAEAEETQSVVEDGGQGPGAPTPLSVLEVNVHTIH